MADLFFSQVIRMTVVSSPVILVVIGTRLLLRRAPKVFSYSLWAVVLFRLLCPFAPEAPVSIVPEITAVKNIPVTETVPTAPSTGNPGTDIGLYAMYLWLAGIAVMLLVSLCRYLQLRRNLIGASALTRNIFIADHIATPFVLGILAPRIYLPSGLSEKERGYIIAHEQHHIRRLDHIWRLLFFCALCLHWFNPLVWLAFILSGRDMEMSCDEAVLQKLGTNVRADYAASLLKLATGSNLSGTPITFGGGNTKERLINMVNWKKPKSWIMILSTILCVTVLAGCAVDPADSSDTNSDNVSHNEVILCTDVTCTDATHDHSLICTADDCTDPAHQHNTSDNTEFRHYTVPVAYTRNSGKSHHQEGHHSDHHS